MINIKLVFSSVFISAFLLSGCTTQEEEPELTQVEPVTRTPTEVKQAIADKKARIPAKGQRTNQECVDIIKAFEGVRLQAYVGPAGHWLIGYGHKAGVRQGMTITQGEAEEFLRDDLREIEKRIGRLVKVNVSNNEFSAMTCLAYNIGWGNFSKSTLLKKVNAQSWAEAANEFPKWRRANGVVSKHLEQRRAVERSLFVSGK